MANERTSVINVAGKDYELVLTTKATREINDKFGGLENIGNKIAEAKGVGEQLDIVVWLITLLANQSILRSNLGSGEKKALLKEEDVEILTSPADLNSYTEAILDCLVKGTKRNVQSEDDSKN
ncbi:MAG: hypothetical protein IK034_03825 [Bacilli bacterium]|nr:hypothetical protein [Bacilli bacterium]